MAAAKSGAKAEAARSVSRSAKPGAKPSAQTSGKASVQRGKRKPVRTQDPEGVQRNIIEIASEEFALNGLAGARIDEIAARTRTSKRMIY
jgi:hypothetical protein